MLPSKVAVDFPDAYVGLFSALEVERDLLKVPHSSLAEAVNFHAASISNKIFFFFLLFSLFFFPKIIFMISRFGVQSMLLARGLQ